MEVKEREMGPGQKACGWYRRKRRAEGEPKKFPWDAA